MRDKQSEHIFWNEMLGLNVFSVGSFMWDFGEKTSKLVEFWNCCWNNSHFQTKHFDSTNILFGFFCESRSVYIFESIPKVLQFKSITFFVKCFSSKWNVQISALTWIGRVSVWLWLCSKSYSTLVLGNILSWFFTLFMFLVHFIRWLVSEDDPRVGEKKFRSA